MCVCVCSFVWSNRKWTHIRTFSLDSTHKDAMTHDASPDLESLCSKKNVGSILTYSWTSRKNKHSYFTHAQAHYWVLAIKKKGEEKHLILPFVQLISLVAALINSWMWIAFVLFIHDIVCFSNVQIIIIIWFSSILHVQFFFCCRHSPFIIVFAL